ncbi:hypothetical protein [Ruegeria sp. EL01]|uniref:hypothetical protein n=1 Tax=Ruegeria sp. EL01 TaxID=2107578 RepID=UPI0013C49F4D|nr:hypothetical protein [Ruegeria sp. EL01]
MGGLNPWVILGVLALVVGSGGLGYRMGYSAAEDDHKAELLEQIEAGQRSEAARIRVANERDDLARMLEEEENADPVIVEQCLSPDRVRRLNALR